MNRVLVLDIETLRDPDVWTPPGPPEPWHIWGTRGQWSGLEAAAQPPAPDHFAPPYGWHPIVIGCVLLEWQDSLQTGLDEIQVRWVGAIEGAPGDTLAEAERRLLRRFADFVGIRPPTIVTWNGRAFDLPGLMLRSMRAGIPCRWYYNSRDTRYRYTEDGHCDLADAMSDYGATRHLGLDGMAKLIGLPGKFGDIDGPGVEQAFAAGRLPEITRYCISDAVQTAFLWLRWQFLKGALELAGYRASAQALLAATLEPVPALAERVDRRVLLLEEPA